MYYLHPCAYGGYVYDWVMRRVPGEDKRIAAASIALAAAILPSLGVLWTLLQAVDY